MKSKRMGCLAVAVLLTGMVLAGCIGSDAGGPTQADDNTTAEADDVDPSQNTNDTDVDDNATDVQDEGPVSYRTPADAMEADPVETGNGMAHFSFEAEAAPVTEVPGVCAVVLRSSTDTEGTTFPTIAEHGISNPGDLTFFDIHLAADSDYQDLGMDLVNESGDVVASADDFASTGEYIAYSPEKDKAQDFTLEIWQSCQDPTDASYTLDVWAWTHEDWNASHPFTDVWQKTYEWGQSEACPPLVPSPPVDGVPTCVSVIVTSGDPTGQTSDGEINTGGWSWTGCATSGGGPSLLPCPKEPYKSVSVIIDDDVAGQQVAATWTTCSGDGDSWCGETDNVNDSKADGNPGPNELTATFCGVVNGLTRDGTTDQDGTGPGVWDQRGEMYRTANGTMAEHPGVSGMAVFLIGPQRGGGGICSDANPYTGPTQGTITIIAQK